MVLPAVPLRLCKGERDRDRARPVEDRRHREVEPRHADPYPVLLLPRRLARDGLRGHTGRRGLPESRGRLRLAAAPSATAGPMRWAPWKFAVSLFSRSSAGLTSPAAAILQEIATVPTSYARLRSLRSRDSPLHA